MSKKKLVEFLVGLEEAKQVSPEDYNARLKQLAKQVKRG